MKNIKFFLIAAIVLTLIAGLITGKLFFIPTGEKPFSPDVIDVENTAVEGDDLFFALRAVEQFLNSRNDGYTIKLRYQENPMTNTDTVIVEVVFYRKVFTPKDPYNPTIVEVRRSISAQQNFAKEKRRILGEILLITYKKLEPWTMTLVVWDMAGNTPSGEISVYLFNHRNTIALGELDPKDITSWTKYSVPKPGSVSTPNIGPAFIPENSAQIPDK